MLATYFKRQTTLAAYYSGPAGPYLDALTNWLEQRGYRHNTIPYGQNNRTHSIMAS